MAPSSVPPFPRNGDVCSFKGSCLLHQLSIHLPMEVAAIEKDAIEGDR